MIENITTVDRSLFHEILKPIHKQKIKTCTIILIVFFVIGILLFFLLNHTMGLEMMLAIAACSVFLSYRFRALLKSQEDNMVQSILDEYESESYDVRYTIDNGIIRNRSHPEDRSYSISDIKKVIETEHYIVCMLEDHVLLTFDKHGFNRGTVDDLTALLHDAQITFA